MKIGKYDITLKNIKAYVQGNKRILESKLGILDEYITEQILWRERQANILCINNKECKCGCPIPDLFYADKTCEDGCYPEMMTESEWESFKNKNHQNMNINLGDLESGKTYTKEVEVKTTDGYLSKVRPYCPCIKILEFYKESEGLYKIKFNITKHALGEGFTKTELVIDTIEPEPVYETITFNYNIINVQ